MVTKAVVKIIISSQFLDTQLKRTLTLVWYYLFDAQGDNLKTTNQFKTTNEFQENFFSHPNAITTTDTILWRKHFNVVSCQQLNITLRIFQSELYVHDLSTGNRTAQLPLDIGSIVGYSGKKKDSEVKTT